MAPNRLIRVLSTVVLVLSVVSTEVATETDEVTVYSPVTVVVCDFLTVLVKDSDLTQTDFNEKTVQSIIKG